MMKKQVRESGKFCCVEEGGYGGANFFLLGRWREEWWV